MFALSFASMVYEKVLFFPCHSKMSIIVPSQLIDNEVSYKVTLGR